MTTVNTLMPAEELRPARTVLIAVAAIVTVLVCAATILYAAGLLDLDSLHDGVTTTNTGPGQHHTVRS